MVGAEGAKLPFSESRFLDFLEMSHRKWTRMTYPPGDDIQKKFFSILYDTQPGPKNFLGGRGRWRRPHPDLQTATQTLYIRARTGTLWRSHVATFSQGKAPSARLAGQGGPKCLLFGSSNTGYLRVIYS